MIVLTAHPTSLEMCRMIFIIVYFRTAIQKYSAPAYFLAQPIIRSRPTWYLPLMPAIVRSLTDALGVHKPAIFTLRAFICSTTELDSDSVHFSALSGRDYILHLIDQSR